VAYTLDKMKYLLAQFTKVMRAKKRS